MRLNEERIKLNLYPTARHFNPKENFENPSFNVLLNEFIHKKKETKSKVNFGIDSLPGQLFFFSRVIPVDNANLRDNADIKISAVEQEESLHADSLRKVNETNCSNRKGKRNFNLLLLIIYESQEEEERRRRHIFPKSG